MKITQSITFKYAVKKKGKCIMIKCSISFGISFINEHSCYRVEIFKVRFSCYCKCKPNHFFRFLIHTIKKDRKKVPLVINTATLLQTSNSISVFRTWFTRSLGKGFETNFTCYYKVFINMKKTKNKK